MDALEPGCVGEDRKPATHDVPIRLQAGPSSPLSQRTRHSAVKLGSEAA